MPGLNALIPTITNALIDSPQWRSLSDEARANFVAEMIRKLRGNVDPVSFSSDRSRRQWNLGPIPYDDIERQWQLDQRDLQKRYGPPPPIPPHAPDPWYDTTREA
jgi:hypothetical protein